MLCVPLACTFACTLVTSPAYAFRTAGDDPAFEGTAKVRWHGEEVTYYIHTSTPPDIGLDELTAAAHGAFERWNEASGSRISFKLVNSTDDAASPGDGVNTIQFLDSGWEARGFDPNAAGLTDISYVQNQVGHWVIAEADLYLNGETHTWSVAAESDGKTRNA